MMNAIKSRTDCRVHRRDVDEFLRYDTFARNIRKTERLNYFARILEFHRVELLDKRDFLCDIIF